MTVAYAKEHLERCDTLDPMRRDYRGRETAPGIAAEIVSGDANPTGGDNGMTHCPDCDKYPTIGDGVQAQAEAAAPSAGIRSWKTTASGFVSAGASLVVFMSTQGVAVPHWLVTVAGFVLVGGLASMGIAGKDFNVSGTDSPPSKDQATK